MKKSLARVLFSPRSVALVGASGDERKNTARPQRYLTKHGYKGRILPINPGRAEIMGLPAYKSVAAAPGPVDHAFIMTPAATVPDILKDCARAGVKVASIFSDGFAETGEEGRRIQEKMVRDARKAGMRLVGPNSMGVIDVVGGAAITVNAVLEMPELIKGTLGVVSQSGTMLGALISRGAARGVGFSRMVSIGNEADFTVGEVADALVDDADTEAILLFLESVRDPPRSPPWRDGRTRPANPSSPTSWGGLTPGASLPFRIRARLRATTKPPAPSSATAAYCGSTCWKHCWKSRRWRNAVLKDLAAASQY